VSGVMRTGPPMVFRAFWLTSLGVCDPELTKCSRRGRSRRLRRLASEVAAVDMAKPGKRVFRVKG